VKCVIATPSITLFRVKSNSNLPVTKRGEADR